MRYFRKHIPTGQIWEIPFEGTKTQLADAVNDFNRISNSAPTPLWTYWY